ncbi:MAG: hypothetical protein R3C24_18280 [Cyanobacteriota/Melainabacteria group bacterium]
MAHAGLSLSLLLSIGLLSGCGGGGDNAEKPAGEEKTDSGTKTDGIRRYKDDGKKVETKPAADPQEVKAYLDGIKAKLDESVHLPKSIVKEAERFRTAHKKEKKWRDNHIIVTLGPEGNVMDVKYNTKFSIDRHPGHKRRRRKSAGSFEAPSKPPTGGSPSFIFMIRLLGDGLSHPG